MNNVEDILWSPPANVWETSRIGVFASRYRPEAVGDYEALWAWSVADTAGFWGAVWEFFDVQSAASPSAVVSGDSTFGASWFPSAQVNYAEHMLRGNGAAGGDTAVIGVSQSRETQHLTLDEIREAVRRAAIAMRELGVGPGDRVAAYLPNVSEALVAFLATASIGAIWSSCAPEFGVRAVLDRWQQIEPKLLLAVDGYRYGSKDIDLAESVGVIRDGLSSVEHTVVLSYLDGASGVADALGWDVLSAETDASLTFEPVPFDHPLYVLYSSGTTGLPKAIVHGHGGVLIEHLKQIGLQMDLGSQDRFFWFSTTGWMMWNFLISGLLVGSSVVLFDGNPAHPDMSLLWSLAEEHQVTFFGAAAPFIVACDRAGLNPGSAFDLSRIRGLGSTGAPLPASGFQWAFDKVAPVQLSSISGGTDVCSAFLGGAPVVPVRAGVIPCRQLGWRIEAYSAEGESVIGEEGELVITAPAPSMPVKFWGDDGSRYRDAYFSTYPDVWRHGDWISIAADGSSVVSGRSDATLNRGGVRLGTADFYSVVEADPMIVDSLVLHLQDSEGGMGELLLFVQTRSGDPLADADRARLVASLRSDLSPRHVPDEIVHVPSIPRTLSGKKLEVPVKRILTGVGAEKAASSGSLVDPTALDAYVDFAASRQQ